ncbi:unnamed protein product [Parascedosporium putredinis]|uniref:Double-strand-break repair protein rad21 n=1 Tax=Parascedosporium putredinis TaxID=1442378 RepID=A0A9P1H750_9PEZI|nr:unnamed protein product [Parascedosporium putredinis]CAI7998315.1 unnamed protein product [Parascedosporium putredinis]
MFYSETLLQKSGPLARVWLSANLERKLSKTHILQSDLGESIEAILMPSQAPMALRLSGQLLLGVVRIYSRKTRYLLDDCNEALMKIKMAFRSSGNNDMAPTLNASNREALLLPDRITPYDNLDILPHQMPLGSWPRWTMSQQPRWGEKAAQFLHSGLDKDDDLALAPLDDDIELELDLGEDDERPRNVDRSIEMGRDAAPAMDDDDIFSEVDLGTRLGKDGGDREPSINLDFDNGVRIADDEGDIQMGDDGLHFNMDDQSAMPGGLHFSRTRISESPLSDIDEDLAREGEEAKIILPDEQTMLSSAYIKEQHANRGNILKPQSFLPKDPYVIALMEMHKNGGFVANVILGNKQSSELKRKRDSGIADMDSDQGLWKSPRLDVDDDDDHLVLNDADAGNQTVGPDGTILEIPADDDMDEGHEREGSPMPAFDETTMPIVHPADSGMVSVGTKHAVHILRDLFGANAEHDAEKRKKTAVVFQDLLPEGQTTKADATKMFFECLVLATKDAIKVEQGSSLGAPIRVRGKRGLWGEWAEREAGGEIAADAEEQSPRCQAQTLSRLSSPLSLEAERKEMIVRLGTNRRPGCFARLRVQTLLEP